MIKEVFICIRQVSNIQKVNLKLLYECNPIAFLTEQAGGMVTDGFIIIMDMLVKNTNNGYNAAARCDLSNQKKGLKFPTDSIDLLR